MKKKTVLAGVLLNLGTGAFGLNPIHEGSYALWPRGVAHAEWRAEGGAIFNGRGDGVQVPLAVSFKPAPRLELGAGLKTAWGGGADPIPYVPLGLKYRMSGATALNLDFFLATRGGGHGLRLGIVSRRGLGSRLASRLSGQLGFFDAFAYRAAMAMEGAWIPSLRLLRGISLECGLAASSQTDEFSRHFALDLQPGLFVNVWGDGGVLTVVTVGLAGDHKESLSVKVALARGF